MGAPAAWAGRSRSLIAMAVSELRRQSPPEALSHRTLPFPSRTRTHHHLLLLLPTQPPGVSSSSPSLPCPRHSSSSTLLSRCLLRGGVRAGLAEERARVGFCSWKASASSAGRHLGPCLPPFSAFFFCKAQQLRSSAVCSGSSGDTKPLRPLRLTLVRLRRPAVHHGHRRSPCRHRGRHRGRAAGRAAGRHDDGALCPDRGSGLPNIASSSLLLCGRSSSTSRLRRRRSRSTTAASPTSSALSSLSSA